MFSVVGVKSVVGDGQVELGYDNQGVDQIDLVMCPPLIGQNLLNLVVFAANIPLTCLSQLLPHHYFQLSPLPSHTIWKYKRNGELIPN
jgi:hypothetical protein